MQATNRTSPLGKIRIAGPSLEAAAEAEFARSCRKKGKEEGPTQESNIERDQEGNSVAGSSTDESDTDDETAGSGHG